MVELGLGEDRRKKRRSGEEREEKKGERERDKLGEG